MRFLAFFPEKLLQTNSAVANVEGEMSRFFKKHYSYQLLIWVVFKKVKRAIEAFLADPENQHMANLAALRAKKAGIVYVAGASFSPSSHLTSHFDYFGCGDPYLNSIYEAQGILKNLELAREKDLREARKGAELPVKIIQVDAFEPGDVYKVIPPIEKETIGVEVKLDAETVTV
jgi:hypothetical protein